MADPRSPDSDVPRAADRIDDPFDDGGAHRDLKGKTIRGGAITIFSQFAQFAVTIVSTVVLARLLSPEDYGLVGMVLAITGFLGLVKDSGLSMATVQREKVTRELVSTVFWINIGLGILISLLCGVLAPALVAFYREPRLYWITLALAATFIVDAAGAQHTALLRRQMRLKAVAVIDTLANLAGVVVAIGLATAGFGYWALVAMQLTRTLVGTTAVWIAEPWRPGRPRHHAGAGSMLKFGGYLTAVNVVNYSCRNVDNVLIGWFWGAASLGLYQKAYSLLMLPISQVNTPISGVAVAALSRIQSDPGRFRRYFLGGYSIAASIVLPIIIAAIVFSEDIVRFVLGDQWVGASAIFRFLAPAALIGALLNPFGWLFVSSGRADRQLRAGLVWAPLIILSFAAGLRYGPEGVAIGYSIMSALLAIPLSLYAVRGTSVRVKDLASALTRPIIAGVLTALAAVALQAGVGDTFPVGVRAIGGCFAVAAIYSFVLLVGLRQWGPYRELLAHVLPGRAGAVKGHHA